MLDQFRSQNYNFLIRFLNTVRASLSWSASSGVILRVALFENPRAPGALPSILYKFFPMYVLRTDELNARLVKYQTKLKVRLEQ